MERGMMRNPDELLAHVEHIHNADGAGRGRLKIFFGYAAGVGKTYAMLEAAHEAKSRGVDVVVGYLEPHQRPDTSALLGGLESLEPRTMSHNGITLREFDIDAALKRAPQVILVDELAHTNAPKCRHRKRFQDVEELLRAGIDVFTTLNVQHLENLNDKIASITQVSVRERVPDRVFDYASSVELVDLEPDELIERLHKGKIYREDAANAALNNFFTKRNLASLRGIALRRVAERLMRNPFAAGSEEEAGNGGSGEDVLVYVTSSKGNARVIRTAASLASVYQGELIALVVTPSEEKQDYESEAMEEMRRLKDNIALAESLGARCVTLYGDDDVFQISQYVPAAGVSRVVVGSSSQRKKWGRDVFVSRLSRHISSAVLVVVPDGDAPRRLGKSIDRSLFSFTGLDIVLAFGAICLASLLGMLLSLLHVTTSVIVMLFLVVVMFVALAAEGIGYGLAASAFGVLALNYFFAEPRFSFEVYGSSFPFIFLFLALAAFAVSSLTIRIKRQREAAAGRAYRTEILLESDRKLQKALTLEDCFEVTAKQVLKFLDRPVVMYCGREDGTLSAPNVYDRLEMEGDDAEIRRYTCISERAVANWVYRNNESAGSTTDTLASAQCYYLPIHAQDRVFGVIGLVLDEKGKNDFAAFEKNLLLAVLDASGQALNRIVLEQGRKEMEVKAKTESLRSNLLRSVSHDLRTPLTSISGDADVLMRASDCLSEERRQNLYKDIYEDAVWLNGLVENLLSITRAESGSLNLNKEPELLCEAIEEALRHISHRSQAYEINIEMEDSMLMALMDERLIVQVLVNLVNNAIAYTEEGSSIKVEAHREGGDVVVQVIDNGPGLSDEGKLQAFDLFYSGSRSGADSKRGMGLGLALCRSIVEEHGGRIWLEDTLPHGCTVSFTLPYVDSRDILRLQGGES